MSKQRGPSDRGTELVEAYRAGALSRRAFSEQAGIAVSTLDYYLRRESERLKKRQRLLPVVVEREESKVPEIAVVVGNGRRVDVRRGFDPELLLRVLSVLERA